MSQFTIPFFFPGRDDQLELSYVTVYVSVSLAGEYDTLIYSRIQISFSLEEETENTTQTQTTNKTRRKKLKIKEK